MIYGGLGGLDAQIINLTILECKLCNFVILGLFL